MKNRTAAISVIVAAVLAAVLIGFAINLHSSQSDSQDNLLARFNDSASNNASLTGALFGSTSAISGAQLAERFGGDVSMAKLDAQVKQGNSPYGVVITDKGRVLATSSAAPASAAVAAAKMPDYVRQALGSQGYGLSDVITNADGSRVTLFAQGFSAADGSRRALVTAIDPLVLTAFLGSYLNKTKQVRGGESYITDSGGVVIAATDGTPGGEPLRDEQLRDKAVHEGQGSYGDHSYAAVPVDGTPWRVVETAPTSVLLSSVRGADKWVPWLIFIAFAIAAVASLVMLRRVLTNAERLKETNAKLEDSNTQLELRAKELQRSNEELEQFASIASHDLSEPLRKVQMFSRQLEESEGKNISDSGRDYIGRMVHASERMETLIQDLLEFSRVTTRGREFSKVDLSAVFSAAVTDLEEQISASGGKVEIGKLPEIDADPLQMRQLAQNLVSNGVKFARKGVPPEVRVDGSVKGGEAQIVVADNGIGFDERYAMRIFRVFERLHGRNDYPGTGIGLALCRKIAERHGGGIVAQGEPGAGATFTVTLPVRQAPPASGNGSKSHTVARPAPEPAKESLHATAD